MTFPHSSKILTYLPLISFLFLFIISSVYAQQNPWLREKPEVVESDMDFDEDAFQKGMNTKITGEFPVNNTNEKISNDTSLKGIRSDATDIMNVNLSLKGAIEENIELNNQKDELESELRSLRGQRAIEINRINSLTTKMRSLAEKTESIVELNDSYAERLFNLGDALTLQKNKYEATISKLTEQLEESERLGKPLADEIARIEEDKMTREEHKAHMINILEEYNKENSRLKMDAALIQYNMGNTYFHKGEYRKAVKKYKKAIQLSPYDAAAHFNLAFVSGEYLKDFDTALVHYQEYKFLNPMADDIPLVEEKILDARLEIRTAINSPIDNMAVDLE